MTRTAVQCIAFFTLLVTPATTRVSLGTAMSTVALESQSPPLSTSSPSDLTTVCEFYNATCVTRAISLGIPATDCYGRQTCPTSSLHICYVVWINETDPRWDGGAGHGHPSGLRVQLMGCFEHEETCSKAKICREESQTARNNGNLFCCCRGNMCNSEFEWVPPTPRPVVLAPSPPLSPPTSSPVSNARLAYLLLPAVIGSVLVLTFAYVYRQRRKAERFRSLPVDDMDLSRHHPYPNRDRRNSGDEGMRVEDGENIHRDIQLLEIKARGRFGAVWKARLGEKTVAVKIFPLQDKNSWEVEKEIYRLPRIQNDNILKYMFAEKRDENLNLQMECWLVTEFHERGSLCDFLKSNIVSWEDLCRIAQSLAAGLTHLHEEISPRSGGLHDGEDMKPAIAHRDFKSKNVLIKADMRACIADFGLALIFEPGKTCGDTHGQVGTRRYMAPEVLEGAIHFSRDAFLRIDMYACGLVLWELASRCTAGHPTNVVGDSQNFLRTQNTNNLSTSHRSCPSGRLPIVSDYKLPFEAEVDNPTLEQMQDLVVRRKVRPLIQDSWRIHEGLASLCDTVEECWDQDAEARLSASCVVERIKAFKEKSFPSRYLHQTQRTTISDDSMNALNNRVSNEMQQEGRNGDASGPITSSPLLYIRPPAGDASVPRGE